MIDFRMQTAGGSNCFAGLDATGGMASLQSAHVARLSATITGQLFREHSFALGLEKGCAHAGTDVLPG